MMHHIIKYSFAIFLFIAALVHVYGLVYNDTSESTASHMVHLVSYLRALYAVLRPFKLQVFIYIAAAVYPFYYHAACALETYNNTRTLNAICILVVILMPLIGGWLFKTSGKKG
jgi:hypothetical protein